VSFKYTDRIQRPGARAQGLGKMMTNTEVSEGLRTKPRTGRTSTRETTGMGVGDQTGPAHV